MYSTIHPGPVSWNVCNSESMPWVRRELPTSDNIHCGCEKASWKIHCGQPKRWGKLFFLSYHFSFVCKKNKTKTKSRENNLEQLSRILLFFQVYYHFWRNWKRCKRVKEKFKIIIGVLKIMLVIQDKKAW